jgi:hypothetical protein
MARKRRRRTSKSRKSRRGGASAPQQCKTALKTCLKNGPALSPSQGSICFKRFNKCR